MRNCWRAATFTVVSGASKIDTSPLRAQASFRSAEAPVPSGAVPTAVRQFQSEIDGIRYADEPRSVRVTVLSLGGALLACAVILAVARVDRVISSTAGKIVSVRRAARASGPRSVDRQEHRCSRRRGR